MKIMTIDNPSSCCWCNGKLCLMLFSLGGSPSLSPTIRFKPCLDNYAIIIIIDIITITDLVRNNKVHQKLHLYR